MLYTTSPQNGMDKFIPDFYLSWTEYIFGDVRNLFFKAISSNLDARAWAKGSRGACTHTLLIGSYSLLGRVPFSSCPLLLFLSQRSMAATHPEWLLSLSYRLGNTGTAVAAVPCKHYFMNPASLAAFPSARPCCSCAHVTELFGKAQPKASGPTMFPHPCKEKHGVREVLACSLMLLLTSGRGATPWTPILPLCMAICVQFAYSWSAAKPRCKSAGFGTA